MSMDISKLGSSFAVSGLASANDAQTAARLEQAERDAKRTTFEKKEIKQLSEDFESLFLNMVLKSMRGTVGKPGLINGGHAEEIYRSMLDDEYSKMMAGQRNTGLADNIEKFLLEAYDNEQKANSADALGVQSDISKAMGLKAYQGLRQDEEPATMKPGPKAFGRERSL